MSIRQFISLCALFSLLAGVLEILNAFHPYASNILVTEILYIATDISLLFAWLGWHLHHHDKVGVVGFLGFMFAFIGTAFIVGPSAQINGIAAYTIGVPVISLGLLLLASVSLYHQSLPKVIPGFFLLAVFVGLLAQFSPVFQQPIVYANLCTGFGLILLGRYIYLEMETDAVSTTSDTA